MRLLRILIGLLLIVLLAFLMYKNSNQPVTIWLYPGMILENRDLATVLISVLAIGILLGFIVGLIQIIAQQRELMRANGQLKKLRLELNNLRHSDLDEEDVFKPAGEPATNLPATVETLPVEKPA